MATQQGFVSQLRKLEARITKLEDEIKESRNLLIDAIQLLRTDMRAFKREITDRMLLLERDIR